MKYLIVLSLLLLAGCGSRQQLALPNGQLPPRPAAATTTPTPEQLMTPDTQARPARSDELLRRSEERRDDKFDLPPT